MYFIFNIRFRDILCKSSSELGLFFSECATTLTDDFGVVTSPNFPQKYENNIDCTWLIELSVEKFIKIEFLSFDLEHHYNCMLVLPSSLFQLELVKGQF